MAAKLAEIGDDDDGGGAVALAGLRLGRARDEIKRTLHGFGRQWCGQDFATRMRIVQCGFLYWAHARPTQMRRAAR
eukprot:2595989-Pyramimonas_sp.AAC.1